MMVPVPVGRSEIRDDIRMVGESGTLKLMRLSAKSFQEYLKDDALKVD